MARIIVNHNVTYLECKDCCNAFTDFNSCYKFTEFLSEGFNNDHLSLDYIEHNKTILPYPHFNITLLFHLFVISNMFYYEWATMFFIQANNENNNIYI